TRSSTVRSAGSTGRKPRRRRSSSPPGRKIREPWRQGVSPNHPPAHPRLSAFTLGKCTKADKSNFWISIAKFRSSQKEDRMDHPLLSYVEGDLFGPIKAMTGKTVLLPHVCNNRGAWGSGFVVPLMRHFPKTRELYMKWFNGETPPEATYPGGLRFGLG